MSEHRILVVGADGLVGGALLRRLEGEVTGTTRRRETVSQERLFLDLAGDVSAWRVPAGFSAAIICAAISSLEACRRDPSGTRRVNVENTLRLAQKLAGAGVFVVFLSSSQVFDGSAPAPDPAAPTCPANEYGRQKVDTERGIAPLAGAILRLTKIFGSGNPLLSGWVKSMRQGQVVRPFSDLSVAPISPDFAAQAAAEIANCRRPGIWQASAEEEVTYATVAKHLAARTRGAGQVRPASAREAMPELEHVPRHSALDSSRLQKELGLIPPPLWQTVEQAAGL